jgi:DNA polymerase-1
MIKLITNQHQLIEVIEYLTTLTEISLDTETTGLDQYTCKLLSLQVGNKQLQYVIDTQKVDILPLKELLETKLILGANLKFDWKFMYHASIDIKYMYDVFLAECVLTTGYDMDNRGLSLEAMAIKYCNIQLDKSIRSRIISEGFSEKVIKYCAEDIEFLEEIKKKQLVEITKWELNKVLDLENTVCRIFSMMEYKGILLDKIKWTEVATKIKLINIDIVKKLDSIIVKESKTNQLLSKFTQVQQDLFSEDIRETFINWASPKQKVFILNQLGVKVDSVADKVLQNNKTKHPIIRDLIELSKHNKLESSFGMDFLKFINPITKRVHADVWQVLQTGRISMSNPNLQQIPSHSELGQVIKSCFVAKKGYKFVSADYGQFELRIIAEYSQDPIWVKAFKDGKDLHSELCTLTFGIPLERVKDPFPGKPDISYRFLQKTIGFGLSYGMSKFKLADTAQITVDEADKIIKKFFKVVPAVEKFLNSLAVSGVKNGYIRTDKYYRRIRWFPTLDRNNFKSVGEVERASKNSVPQGTNSNATKLALCMIQDIIDKNNYPVDILLTIHDEIITECREDFAIEWKVILEKIMIEAAQVIITTVPIEVEGTINDYWAK